MNILNLIVDATAELQSETTNSTMENGSCVGKCGRWDKNCYCDNACEGLNDCCPDYLLLCQNISLGTEIVTEWVTITDAKADLQSETTNSTMVNGSCLGKCGRWDKNCYCDNICEELTDCCPDYLLLCQNISLGTEIVTEWVTITDATTDFQKESSISTIVNDCVENIYLNSNDVINITSSNYPDNYDNNENCEWIVESPQNTGILLTFYDIELESCCDFLIITYVDVNGDTLLIEWNSNNSLLVTTHLNITFQTDLSVVNRGFALGLKIINIDQEAPDIINCPWDLTVNTSVEAFAINVTWVEPTATDNSGETPVPVADYTSGDNMFGIGNTTIQYNVSDSAGNFNDSCTFVIHVEDKISPTIDCPANVTSNNYIGEGYGLVNVSTDIGSPNATVTWDPPETSDNTGGLVTVMSSSFESGDMIPIGTNTITYIATDPSGNSDTCVFGLKVEDNEDPVLVCAPNITTTTADDSNQALNVSWTDPIVIDNSGEDIKPTSKYYPGNNEFDIGRTDVIYDSVDSSRNSATCTFTVTVIDQEAPDIFNCPMDLIVDTATGEAFAINVTWVEPTATDNSDETPIPVSDYTSGDMFALGNTTVQYNVSDSAGNFNDSCSFFVTVKDLETPSFNGTCPSSPLEVPTDPPTGNRLIGEMFATVIWTIPSATDNVGVVMVTNNSYPGSPVYFNISSDYDMNVAYAAQDAAGNVAICSFLVKVVDEEPPVFYVCDNSTVYINNTAGENFAPYTWMEPANADNILVDSERSTPNFAPGQDFTIGENYIIYINYDTSGNQNSCNFTLVVVDIEDPAIANCPNNTASITDNGKNYSNITWTPEPTATDNDGVVSFEKTHNSGDLFYLGVTTVNYTAVDPSGNVAICLFNITLTDLESPEIIDCPMDSIVNTTGEASVFNVTWIVPTATDNSGETPVPVADYTSGDNMFGIGTTTVQYNVSDSAGNFNDSCTFVIHVEGINTFTFQYAATAKSVGLQ
ncbi:hyalin-like [Antedon mediterranea]|uniref:hyalin-like n=1 Tax=Antedon mediterranea TaxID=105859 RepID=UPI003AF9C947